MLLAFACAGITKADETHVLIGNLYYDLYSVNTDNPFAVVSYKTLIDLDNYTTTGPAEQSSYVSGNLVIPDKVTYNSQQYTVTKIGVAAFSYCENLTSVVIPNTVTNIGVNSQIPQQGAFYRCKNLQNVTMPASLTEIALYAFKWCESLQEIEIPSLTQNIATGAFGECPNLIKSCNY